MLRNYLVVAARNLLRHKLYSLINVFGLAVGMASCILILLYVRHELSYERFMRTRGRSTEFPWKDRRDTLIHPCVRGGDGSADERRAGSASP